MTIIIKLEIKNLNTVLTEKQRIYQHYILEKLINVNTLQVKKYYLWIKKRVLEEAKFAYSPLGKALEKKSN